MTMQFATLPFDILERIAQILASEIEAHGASHGPSFRALESLSRTSSVWRQVSVPLLVRYLFFADNNDSKPFEDKGYNISRSESAIFWTLPIWGSWVRTLTIVWTPTGFKKPATISSDDTSFARVIDMVPRLEHIRIVLHPGARHSKVSFNNWLFDAIVELEKLDSLTLCGFRPLQDTLNAEHQGTVRGNDLVASMAGLVTNLRLEKCTLYSSSARAILASDSIVSLTLDECTIVDEYDAFNDTFDMLARSAENPCPKLQNLCFKEEATIYSSSFVLFRYLLEMRAVQLETLEYHYSLGLLVDTAIQTPHLRCLTLVPQNFALADEDADTDIRTIPDMLSIAGTFAGPSLKNLTLCIPAAVEGFSTIGEALIANRFPRLRSVQLTLGSRRFGEIGACAREAVALRKLGAEIGVRVMGLDGYLSAIVEPEPELELVMGNEPRASVVTTASGGKGRLKGYVKDVMLKLSKRASDDRRTRSV